MGRLILITTALALAASLSFFIGGEDNNDNTDSTLEELYPVRRISHAHGLAVDVSDSSRVYIATHHGLLVLKDKQDLYRIGESQDDFMGFSVHPFYPNIFYTSGHPAGGGNLGFQRSKDRGLTWEKISDGVNGPVDFHAMTVSPVNPDTIYGWYQNRLHRSNNGGLSWEIVPANLFGVIDLVADTEDKDTVYAGTNNGLWVSTDRGERWNHLSDRIDTGAVIALAVNPQNSQNLISFSEQQLGLAVSHNGGMSWDQIDEEFGGETVLYLSYDLQNPNNIYAITNGNSLYESLDSGYVWKEIF